jgi:hypothetical protein
MLNGRAKRRLYADLNPAKLRVIDYCFEQLGCRSFADLGGVWAVDGGYSRYAADIHEAESGVIVDDDFTDEYLKQSRRLPKLTHVRRNFGDPALIEGLGDLDVAFFYDVLVHQVAPDWDELLELYAPHVRCFGIVQPQWNGDESVRLFDLGEEAYLAAIPSVDQGPGTVYDGLFDRLDEINERRGRPWRDVHDVWQWGITDAGLIDRMADLGFGLRYFENTGSWRGLEDFHEGAFIFDRATPAG